MPQAKRIYTVTNVTTGTKTLVEAGTQAAAVRSVVADTLTVEVTPTNELALMLESGMRVKRPAVELATTEE